MFLDRLGKACTVTLQCFKVTKYAHTGSACLACGVECWFTQPQHLSRAQAIPIVLTKTTMLSLNCHFALGETELGQGIELVSLADAAFLAQAVDVPASASGPLFRTMFPRLGVRFSEKQEDEIIRWHAEGIEEAIIGGRTSLRKLRHSDGRVVGLAGWVVERCIQEQANDDRAVANATRADKREIDEPWLPEGLDVPAWLAVSEALKKERQKATRHLEHICRRVQTAPT